MKNMVQSMISHLFFFNLSKKIFSFAIMRTEKCKHNSYKCRTRITCTLGERTRIYTVKIKMSSFKIISLSMLDKDTYLIERLPVAVCFNNKIGWQKLNVYAKVGNR